MRILSVHLAGLRRLFTIAAGLAAIAVTGVAHAAVTFTPTALTAFTSPVGTASAAQTVTVKNASTTASLFKVSAVSSLASYVIGTNTCGTAAATVTLAANGTCSFTVTYTATSTAATSATITVNGATTSTGATASQGTLTASGSSNLLSLLNGTAAITTYAFPSTPAASTATLAVTVKNLSTTTALSGVTVAISGTGFTQASTCAATLAASGTCVSNITFAPSAAGSYTGTLTVSATNSAASSVALTGTGSTPVPAWETTNTLGTGTAMFMAGPPMRYATTTGLPGCNAPTGGFVHTTQGGDICAFASANYTFSYDSSQTGTAYGDYYIYQASAGAAFNKTTDYFGISVLAPYANANKAITPVGIANSAAVLIRLGNQVTPTTTNGTANVFSVTLKNQAIDGTWPAVNPAACTTDVVMLTPATGTANGPGVASFTGAYLGQASGTYVAALGLLDYAIPLSTFTCTTNDSGTGAATTIAALKATGVTQVAIAIVGSKNPKVVATSVDAISVGGISFQ